MKRTFLPSILLFVMAGPLMSTIQNAYSQDPRLAQALIGTWERRNHADYAEGGVTGSCTFYPNGTYKYVGMVYVMNVEVPADVDLEQNDRGIWWLRGNVLYTRSYDTGAQAVFQLRMVQRDALYANGELWIKQ